MCLFLLLHEQCSACVACLTWMVHEMGGMWSYWCS